MAILGRQGEVAMGAEGSDQFLFDTETSNAKEKTRSKIASNTRKMMKSKQKEEYYWWKYV